MSNFSVFLNNDTMNENLQINRGSENCHPFDLILRRVLNRSDVSMCEIFSQKINATLERVSGLGSEKHTSQRQIVINDDNVYVIFGLCCFFSILCVILILFCTKKVLEWSVERKSKRKGECDVLLIN